MLQGRKGCSVERCRGGCRGIAYAASGDLYAECPNCFLDFYWKALRDYPERFAKKDNAAACTDKAADSRAETSGADAETKKPQTDAVEQTRPEAETASSVKQKDEISASPKRKTETAADRGSKKKIKELPAFVKMIREKAKLRQRRK